MKHAFLLPMLLLGGCMTEVHHATRSKAEMQRDIRICTEHGKLSEPIEPIAALNVAYECLERKGYKRGAAKLRS